MKNINARVLLAMFIIPLGMILAFVPANTTHPYKLSPGDLLEYVNSGMQYFTPDEVAHMIVSEDPSLVLIDVRAETEYEKYPPSRGHKHPPGISA